MARARLERAGLKCVQVHTRDDVLVVEGNGGSPAVARVLLDAPGVLWIGAEAPRDATARIVARIGRDLPSGSPVHEAYGRLIASAGPGGDAKQAALEALKAVVAGAGDDAVRPVFEWLDGDPSSPRGWRVRWLDRSTALSGTHVQDAEATLDRRGSAVLLHLDAEGTRAFADLTRSHVHEVLLIVIDDIVESAPLVMDPIEGGAVRITMGAGQGHGQAEHLASELANPFPVALRRQNEQWIGPAAPAP